MNGPYANVLIFRPPSLLLFILTFLLVWRTASCSQKHHFSFKEKTIYLVNKYMYSHNSNETQGFLASSPKAKRKYLPSGCNCFPFNAYSTCASVLSYVIPFKPIDLMDDNKSIIACFHGSKNWNKFFPWELNFSTLLFSNI